MKTHFAVLSLAVLLPAQQPASDPFIKGGGKPKAGAPAPQQPQAEPDVVFLLESFTLPQSQYTAWIDTPADREKLHARVIEAVQKGTAALDGCHFIRTRPGTRCTLDASEEFIYPTQWSKADHTTGLQYPEAMEMSPMGDRLEFEPVVDDHGSLLTLNHSLERARFLGYRPVKTAARFQGAVTAALAQQKTLAIQRLVLGLPALAGTMGVGDAITLVFITPRLISTPPPAEPVSKGAGNPSLTARVISLGRTRAWELLRQHAGRDDALLTQLRGLIASKDAVLEHISTTTSQAGQRMVQDSGEQHYYGTEFDAPFSGTPARPAIDAQTPAQPAVRPYQASVTAFDCRQLGFHWESETVLYHPGNGTASTDLSFSFVKFNGTVKDPAWSPHYPTWPLFINQQATTSVRQPLGTTLLVSTLSPPGETGINGRKDDSRVWFLFLETTLE